MSPMNRHMIFLSFHLAPLLLAFIITLSRIFQIMLEVQRREYPGLFLSLVEIFSFLPLSMMPAVDFLWIFFMNLRLFLSFLSFLTCFWLWVALDFCQVLFCIYLIMSFFFCSVDEWFTIIDCFKKLSLLVTLKLLMFCWGFFYVCVHMWY